MWVINSALLIWSYVRIRNAMFKHSHGYKTRGCQLHYSSTFSAPVSFS